MTTLMKTLWPQANNTLSVTHSEPPTLTLSRGSFQTNSLFFFYYAIYYAAAINAGALIKASGGLIGGTTSIKEKQPQTGRSSRCHPEPRGARKLVRVASGQGHSRHVCPLGAWCFTIAVKGAVFGTRSEERAQPPSPAAAAATAAAAGMQLCEEKGRRENWEVDSCFWGVGGGRIGGPFVSCQEKSVTNYLCLSPKGQLWKLFGWVRREDA